jgi:biopolymer transport protein ExbD
MVGSIRLKPGTFEQHLVARAHKQKAEKRTLMVSLTLTAMVDMFAVLVIFLLQSFSASPELIVTKGLVLPQASTGAEIIEAPVLSLVDNQVYFDQKPVGAMAEVLRKPSLLANRLQDFREKWQSANPDKTFSGQVNLQADRETQSTAVSQFMGILSAEHFHSILLAVVNGNGR